LFDIYILIGNVLIAISTRGLIVSLIGGGLALVLGLQFFLQSRILNIILGGIMFMIGGFFSLAVLSEFNEFEIVTQDVWLLLIVGMGLCISVVAMSVVMIWQAMQD
jgi:hypothetical protein